MSEALAGEINVGKVRKLQKRVTDNSIIMEGVVDKLVRDYCGNLDKLCATIKRAVNKDDPPTDGELDTFMLRLSCELYDTVNSQESLGIREDVAKAVKMELFNEVHKRTEGTIADKQAAADAATQNEYLVHAAYQRAYKKVKQRTDAAYELLNSLKKVTTRRISEMELSKNSGVPVQQGGNRRNAK